MRHIFFLLFLLPFNTLSAQLIEYTEEGYEMMRVYFGGGSYYFDEQQKKAVHQWLQSKDNLNEYEILLHSHTDNIGSRGYNLFLSQMRSESVIQALGEIFIEREEIRVNDFGEDAPTFDNNSWEGRLNNRRVDIILLPPST